MIANKEDNAVALFISIPKNASTSLHEILEIGFMRELDIKKTIDRTHVISEFHQRLCVYEQRYKLDNIFVFCFVRNPYERVKSWYQYFSAKKNKNIEIKNSSLNSWILDDKCNTNWEKMNKTDWKEENLSPILQSNYLKSNKGINIDFIGRFENFDEDVKKLKNILNKKFKERGFEKVIDYHKMWHKNKSTKIDEELTEESKNMIYELFKEDFERFGYEK